MSPVSATTRDCFRRDSSWVMTNLLGSGGLRNLVCRYACIGARPGTHELSRQERRFFLLLRGGRRAALGTRRRPARLDAHGAPVPRLPAPRVLARALVETPEPRRARQPPHRRAAARRLVRVAWLPDLDQL